MATVKILKNGKVSVDDKIFAGSVNEAVEKVIAELLQAKSEILKLRTELENYSRGLEKVTRKMGIGNQKWD